VKSTKIWSRTQSSRCHIFTLATTVTVRASNQGWAKRDLRRICYCHASDVTRLVKDAVGDSLSMSPLGENRAFGFDRIISVPFSVLELRNCSAVSRYSTYLFWIFWSHEKDNGSSIVSVASTLVGNGQFLLHIDGELKSYVRLRRPCLEYCIFSSPFWSKNRTKGGIPWINPVSCLKEKTQSTSLWFRCVQGRSVHVNRVSPANTLKKNEK
jgi:hypothetical protein